MAHARPRLCWLTTAGLTMALRRLGAGALLLCLVLAPASAEPRTFVIDPAHFSIVFNAEHIGYERLWGMFLKGEGRFVFDEDTRALSDLRVTIDTTSVFSNHTQRDQHLRSADFLDAKQFPLMTFVMTDATPVTDRTGTVTGDLTLRGVTRPVTLDVTLNKIGPYPFGGTYVAGISAKTRLKRSDFGMVYAVENQLVGDMVEIHLDLEAIRQ
ncbi:YceI family protein [Stappia indica]|uniref:YceI family protein n=1 Tax=Stappia indica TaxID=538381 RepID=UPI001CD291D7|nr:YceI family protein [Stappia indica]MCA1298379.1 YceI family protein [Stappia indica]